MEWEAERCKGGTSFVFLSAAYNAIITLGSVSRFYIAFIPKMQKEAFHRNDPRVIKYLYGVISKMPAGPEKWRASCFLDPFFSY